MGNLVKNSKKKEEDGQVNDVKVIPLNDLYSGLLYSCLIESDWKKFQLQVGMLLTKF